MKKVVTKTKATPVVKHDTAAFDWKGLVATLNELDVKIPASTLSAFIEAKGLTVSARSIAATRANLNR